MSAPAQFLKFLLVLVLLFSKIEQELKYIDELNLRDILEKLANLNIVPQVLEIPEIKSEEIGKSNLFE
jgi:hypothetical protein